MFFTAKFFTTKTQRHNATGWRCAQRTTVNDQRSTCSSMGLSSRYWSGESVMGCQRDISIGDPSSASHDDGWSSSPCLCCLLVQTFPSDPCQQVICGQCCGGRAAQEVFNSVNQYPLWGRKAEFRRPPQLILRHSHRPKPRTRECCTAGP